MSSDYREDLAWIHHTGFSDVAESAAAWLRTILPRGLIVDVGCGSGVLARELTRDGFDVLGIDPSSAMIELAKGGGRPARSRDASRGAAMAPGETPAAGGRDGRPPRFELGSFATCTIPPCAAVTAIGEVLNYGCRDDLPSFFRRAAHASMLVFDIAERGSYPPHDERRIGGDDWSVIAIKDSDGARVTRRILTFREIDGETRRSEEIHTLELYDRGEILQMLRDTGFSVRVRRSYGTRRLPRGHAVYIATRRPRSNPDEVEYYVELLGARDLLTGSNR